MPAGLRSRDVLGAVRDARRAAASSAPLVVSGVLAAELARELRAGSGDVAAIRVGGGPAGAAALVVVLAGAPEATAARELREAARLGVPVVAVQTDQRAGASLPYVLATEVVACRPGHGFPAGEIARALARRLGHDAVPLAGRLPALREAVARELIESSSRRAALVGTIPSARGAHFPAMALVQVRLVLDLAAAHGLTVDEERAPELGAVAGAALGLRALVRRLPRRLPLIGAVTGYLGTRAIGEAALRRYAGA